MCQKIGGPFQRTCAAARSPMYACANGCIFLKKKPLIKLPLPPPVLVQQPTYFDISERIEKINESLQLGKIDRLSEPFVWYP